MFFIIKCFLGSTNSMTDLVIIIGSRFQKHLLLSLLA